MCLKIIYKDCPKNLRRILKIILFEPGKHKISPLQYIKLGLKNFCQEFRESFTGGYSGYSSGSAKQRKGGGILSGSAQPKLKHV